VVAVLVSWRQVDQLAACLDALAAQTHPHLEVVVVDNASGDGSLELARGYAAGSRRRLVHVVANPTNRGFAGGVHDGLDAATPGWDAAWLVNVDALPAPDHLAHLVAALSADPGCAAVQGTLVRTHRGPDGVEVVDSTGIEATGARLFRDRDEAHPASALARPAGEVFGVTGACSLFRRRALEDVAWSGDGPAHRRVLTEELFAFFEDVELAWRLQRRGWRCRYEPAAVARHERGGAGPRRSPVVEELNFANRLLVLRTCDGGRTAWRAAPEVVATTVLKLGELTVTVPAALLPTLRRLRRGWRGASARRREVDGRARRTCDEVAGRWFVPFRWRPWITTWWWRVRGRAPGVAGGGR
jgi:GT2 family glycosyltransferase